MGRLNQPKGRNLNLRSRMVPARGDDLCKMLKRKDYMAEPARRRATYNDLYEIPENMIGEIIDGELTATPRPSIEHGYSTYSLGARLTPYHFGHGDRPGGWIIL